MRTYMLISVALIAVGAFGLTLEHLVFDGLQEIIDAGSIKVTARTDRLFPLSTLASVAALAGGLALLVFGRPRGGTAE